MNVSLRDVMLNTDWTEFKLQKAELVAAYIERPRLEGLVNWLDAVQDALVAEGIVQEGVVFALDSEAN